MPGGTAVAHSRQGAESTLRGYLLADAKEFRRRMTETLLDDSAGSAECAWRECSKAVDGLTAGKAYQFHRYELPDGHPVRGLGEICDLLTLDVDDVLRVIPSNPVYCKVHGRRCFHVCNSARPLPIMTARVLRLTG
jgi:hypothetical protein